MKYCDVCFYSLDIKKSSNKKEETISNPENFVEIYQTVDKTSITFSKKDLEDYLNNNKFDEKKKKDILDTFSKLKKKEASNYYYNCTNCESTFDIDPNTLIYSINFDINNGIVNNNVDMKINDPILPRTKDYICPNKKCESHNNSKNKESIWYRTVPNEFNIEYICCVCNERWIIS